MDKQTFIFMLIEAIVFLIPILTLLVKLGKPIYRKVFTGLSWSTGSSNWEATGITITGVSQLINVVGMRESNKGIFNPTSSRMNDTSVDIYSDTAAVPRVTTTIIEYTKTTD